MRKKIEAIDAAVDTCGAGGATQIEGAHQNSPLTNVFGCNRSLKAYSTVRELVSCFGEVQPQTVSKAARINLETARLFAKRGRKAYMALALQVVSSHVLGALDIARALSAHSALTGCLLPHAGSEADALKRPNYPRLFLLDGCSLTLPLGPLSGRLRANSPGSKFLALLPPNRSDLADMMCLFHWGIDGMVVLDKGWKSELPAATVALLGNQVWVPPEVLRSFVMQMKMLLERQLLPGQSLTNREGQVLQLLFRRLTNKEIACELKISERTAKFHVCNLLNRLGLENRKSLLEAFGLRII